MIKNAAIELYSEIPQAQPKAKPATATAESKPSQIDTANEQLTAQDVFSVVRDYVAKHPELVAKTKTVFLFKLNNPSSTWTLDLKNGEGACVQGEHGKADVTLELDEQYIETVVTSSLADVQKLFFGGQLKISGNIMASNKLMVLQDIDPALYQQAKQQRLGSSAHSSTAEQSQPTKNPKNNAIQLVDIFTAVDGYLKDNPTLAEKTKTTFQFHITHPDSSWFIDLKNGAGCAGSGEIDKADVTLSLDEQHIPTVFGGSLADVQKLFFGGQLKISGNVMASNKLTALQDMGQARVEAARDQRLAGGNTAQPTQHAAKKVAYAEQIFAALADSITAIKAGSATVQFQITEPDSAFVVDFVQGTVTKGNTSADSTFTLSDANLAALVKGERSSQDLYQHGEMRLVQQLQQLVGLI